MSFEEIIPDFFPICSGAEIGLPAKLVRIGSLRNRERRYGFRTASDREVFGKARRTLLEGTKRRLLSNAVRAMSKSVRSIQRET